MLLHLGYCQQCCNGYESEETKSLSHVRLCDPTDHSPSGPSVHGDSPGKDTGVGCHALLQGNLPNLGIKSWSQPLQTDSLSTEPPVGAYIFLNYYFWLLWINTQSSVVRLYGSSIFNSLRNLRTIFHSVYTNLHSHQTHEGSLFSTYLPTLVLSCLFGNSHSVLL